MKQTILVLIAAILLTSHGRAQVYSFDSNVVGSLPAGFVPALTGKGKPGVWVVAKDSTAPSAPHVLAQTDRDRTDYRFPLCLVEAASLRDVDLSVKFKPVGGSVDQAAGLVWRYTDQDNYYLVRANALEDNVVLYKVQHGKRSDLPIKGKGRTYGMKVRVPFAEWSTLRVVARGERFEVLLNGNKLFDVEDRTFVGAGKVGLWTKADSYTLFDDFVVAVPK